MGDAHLGIGLVILLPVIVVVSGGGSGGGSSLLSEDLFVGDFFQANHVG